MPIFLLPFLIKGAAIIGTHVVPTLMAAAKVTTVKSAIVHGTVRYVSHHGISAAVHTAVNAAAAAAPAAATIAIGVGGIVWTASRVKNLRCLMEALGNGEYFEAAKHATGLLGALAATEGIVPIGETGRTLRQLLAKVQAANGRDLMADYHLLRAFGQLAGQVG